MLPSAYHQLVQALDQLPAIGPKAADRLAQHILNNGQLQPLLQALTVASKEIQRCKHCQSYSTAELCPLCVNPQRQQSKILVLANINHQLQAEEKGWQGSYFILHGLLSPMVGIGPSQLALNKLQQRLLSQQIQQVIIALEDNAEGRATSQFIQSLPELTNISVEDARWQNWISH